MQDTKFVLFNSEPYLAIYTSSAGYPYFEIFSSSSCDPYLHIEMGSSVERYVRTKLLYSRDLEKLTLWSVHKAQRCVYKVVRLCCTMWGHSVACESDCSFQPS